MIWRRGCAARGRWPSAAKPVADSWVLGFVPDFDRRNAMPSFGIQELLIVFVILLVIFGGSKLPLLGRGMGEGIRNFKRGLRGDDSSELEEKQS